MLIVVLLYLLCCNWYVTCMHRCGGIHFISIISSFYITYFEKLEIMEMHFACQKRVFDGGCFISIISSFTTLYFEKLEIMEMK